MFGIVVVVFVLLPYSLANVARIYGGSVSPPGFLPFQVGIFIPLPAGFNPPYVLCGGVILDSTHVLTAGHCAYDVSSKFLFNVSSVNFRVGTQYNVTSPYYGQVIYVHPSLVASIPSTSRVDMSVFKVSPPFVFDSYVQPVILPNATQTLEVPGSIGTVSGYGLTPSGLPSTQLLYVNLPIVSSATCNAALQGAGLGDLPRGCFCAGGAAGQSFCTGDSGGAFVVSINGSWVLAGIVRGFGSPTCGTAGAYGVFSSYQYPQARSFVQSAVDGTATPGAPSSGPRVALALALLILPMLLPLLC